MNLDFLGKGWNFPFGYDKSNGSVLFSSGVENIRQNILIILGTRQGERQMLPRFGCKIHDLLFDLIGKTQASLKGRVDHILLDPFYGNR